MYKPNRLGFNLIELLIVVAIIAMLIQLALPAVQSSREAARRTACQDHLRQIGLATASHEVTLGHLPTAGWGWAWIGDPNRGTGRNQPGSWAYQLLPYMEEGITHDTGLGLKGQELYESLAKLAETPVAIYYCPSRRPPSPMANMGPSANIEGETGDEQFWYNAVRPALLAKLDYAANIGDLFVYWNAGPSPEDAESGKGFFQFAPTPEREFTIDDITGVVVQRQPYKYAQILDGLSKTYFVGEKRLPESSYFTGENLNDDQSSWNGDDLDLLAATDVVPWKDGATPEAEGPGSVPFGSAHPNGCNMVLCDGSVTFIAYDIDPEVHRLFGNRHDVDVADALEDL